MEWATQKKGWEQPAANGSGHDGVMGPVDVADKSPNADEAGNAHVDSPAVAEKNFNWK